MDTYLNGHLVVGAIRDLGHQERLRPQQRVQLIHFLGPLDRRNCQILGSPHLQQPLLLIDPAGTLHDGREALLEAMRLEGEFPDSSAEITDILISEFARPSPHLII